ncbi:MAG: tol-pal system protein YbgF [Deltaproteobacteria bacterium]|nr:tol-pal system protein YbgF [Deltaproteobacteria bacterium]
MIFRCTNCLQTAVLALALAASACADKTVQQQQGDRLAAVEAQLISLQAQLDQMQSSMDDNRSAVLILEDKLDTARQYINTIKTNQELKIIRVTPEMMASASDLPPQPSAPRAPEKPKVPPLASARPAQPKPAEPAAPVQVATGRTSDYSKPLELYGAAFKLFEAGQYDEGMELFREFVRRWPKHDYADNSQYWIGECYYSRSQYEQAITEFEQVLKRYPTGNKAPDALLKVGFSLQNLGRDREARSTLQKLLNEYPFSDAAPKARQRLADLAQNRN